MKYQKYLVLAFLGAMFLPLLSAKTIEAPREELNLNSIRFIELDKNTELGFDTAEYLPEGFDAHTDIVPVEGVNYIEEDVIQLNFDTADYLPKGFDPYKR